MLVIALTAGTAFAKPGATAIAEIQKYSRSIGKLTRQGFVAPFLRAGAECTGYDNHASCHFSGRNYFAEFGPQGRAISFGVGLPPIGGQTKRCKRIGETFVAFWGEPSGEEDYSRYWIFREARRMVSFTYLDDFDDDIVTCAYEVGATAKE